MELLRLFPRYAVEQTAPDCPTWDFRAQTFCTGGHNYHGKYEYVCVESMEQTVNILTEIVKKFLQ